MSKDKKNLSQTMSKDLISVAAEMPLHEAYAVLRYHHIRHLPVVDNLGNLVGIISEQEFDRAKIPETFAFLSKQLPARFPPQSVVGDFMLSQLHVISMDGDIKDALDIMIQTKTTACLVEKDNVIVGIVTTEDLLKLLKDYLDNPSGSLRSRIETLIVNSPLGAIGHMLTPTGI
jgi:CBS domain-containing protein